MAAMRAAVRAAATSDNGVPGRLIDLLLRAADLQAERLVGPLEDLVMRGREALEADLRAGPRGLADDAGVVQYCSGASRAWSRSPTFAFAGSIVALRSMGGGQWPTLALEPGDTLWADNGF